MAGTGLTDIWLAKYNYDKPTNKVSYTDGFEAMDAMSIEPEMEKSDGKSLYTNNKVKESRKPKFKKGKLKVGTDDLTQLVSCFLSGIEPEQMKIGEETFEVIRFGNNINPPELGLGTIRTGQLSGEEWYRAYIYTKIQFEVPMDSATTEGEEIEWQTPSLEAAVYRDDTENEDWHVEHWCKTKAEARNFIKAFLNITDTGEEESEG